MAMATLGLLGQLPSRSLLILVLFCTCNTTPSNKIIADRDTLTLVNKRGFYLYRDLPFSGMIFQLDKNRDTLSIENYQDGLSHGVFKRFYPKNIVFEKRSYNKGSKEGVHLGYWKNGSLAFAYNLKNDIYHGTLKEWTKSGQIIKSLNYINGQEFGHQQLWYDNGEIRSNYIIKNNRRYGLLGTKNCVNVSDSIQ